MHNPVPIRILMPRPLCCCSIDDVFVPTEVPFEDGFLAKQSACGGWHTLVLIRWDEDESEFETESETETEAEAQAVPATACDGGEPHSARAAAIAPPLIETAVVDRTLSEDSSEGETASSQEEEADLGDLLGLPAGKAPVGRANAPQASPQATATPLGVGSTARERRRQDRAST